MEVTMKDGFLDRHVPVLLGATELVASTMRMTREKAKFASLGYVDRRRIQTEYAAATALKSRKTCNRAPLNADEEAEVQAGADKFVKTLQLWVLRLMWKVEPSDNKADRRKLQRFSRLCEEFVEAADDLVSATQSAALEIEEHRLRLISDATHIISWFEHRMHWPSNKLFYARSAEDALLRSLMQTWRRTTRSEPSLTSHPRSGFLWLVRELLELACEGRCRKPIIGYVKYQQMVKRERVEHPLDREPFISTGQDAKSGDPPAEFRA
jgi:hypothetical protein